MIYASTALESLEFPEIQDLLTVANRKNEEYNLTGMLLYNGTYFLQVLEGDTKDIESLMKNLQKDHRHSKIVVLGEKEIVQRDFKQWNMGCVNGAQELKEVMLNESNQSTFNPYAFKYDEALQIIKKLSYLI